MILVPESPGHCGEVSAALMPEDAVAAGKVLSHAVERLEHPDGRKGHDDPDRLPTRSHRVHDHEADHREGGKAKQLRPSAVWEEREGPRLDGREGAQFVVGRGGSGRNRGEQPRREGDELNDGHAEEQQHEEPHPALDDSQAASPRGLQQPERQKHQRRAEDHAPRPRRHGAHDDRRGDEEGEQEDLNQNVKGVGRLSELGMEGLGACPMCVSTRLGDDYRFPHAHILLRRGRADSPGSGVLTGSPTTIFPGRSSNILRASSWPNRRSTSARAWESPGGRRARECASLATRCARRLRTSSWEHFAARPPKSPVMLAAVT